MKAIILLGGKGTRLLPLTIHKPKPLISFFNRPFITYQIELLRQHGINEIIFSLGHLAGRIKDFLKSRKDWGVSVKYVEEDEPLGTAGAFKKAESMLRNEMFIVLNGDILTNFDLAELISFHRLKKSMATIGLATVEDPSQYGLVKINKSNSITQFLEKPTPEEAGNFRTINAGIYVFEPDIFSYIPPRRKFSSERALFPILLQRKEAFFGFVSKDYWIDIGTLGKYKQAHQDILDGKITFPFLSFKKLESGVYLEGESRISPNAMLIGPILVGAKCRIADEVQISAFSVIGKDCNIESGASIMNSIVLDGVKIGKNVKMHGCIIGQNCQIEDEVILSDGAVLGDRSTIRAHSRL